MLLPTSRPTETAGPGLRLLALMREYNTEAERREMYPDYADQTMSRPLEEIGADAEAVVREILGG